MIVLTHQEAAAFLKVNQATLRKLRRRGEIHGKLVGTQWRYTQEELEGYLRDEVVSAVPSGQPVDAPSQLVHHRGFYAVPRGR